MNIEKKLKKILAIAAVGTVISFVLTKAIAHKKKGDSVFENEPDEQNPLEGKRVVFIENENDIENADGVRGHLEAIGDSVENKTFYNKYIKRLLDLILSFGGMVVLAPIMGILSLAIVIDDPGPVFFTQKRIGKNKKYFKLHKFRSMKMSTPHEVPTHMLENPDQYITRVGKFIRAHSLDELPQIWDIFLGNMSVIGPRPALWNQDVLTAERDKFGVNDIKPGLTGWAQINGRDELEIPDKARLDGEYVEKLGFMMDARIFLGSLHVFRNDDSLVEGGTGKMKEEKKRICYTDNKSDEELIGHIGFGETVVIDTKSIKKVLITGAGSYIGDTFIQYAKEHYPSLIVDSIDLLDSNWRDSSFSNYDIVYHVAGIAHADVENVDEKTKAKYYSVNTDLAIEVCKKAKSENVKVFVFMSSMIVYGDSATYKNNKIINELTVPHPSNFYGDSKLQADIAVRSLANKDFKVIVLRPPMIYGKNSKGNYQTLTKIAKKTPIFPKVTNNRSMLYVGNLCEFLCQVMLIKEIKENSVVLLPQNAEWVKTVDMVKEIANVNGKKMKVYSVFKPFISISSRLPGRVGKLTNKAFGNFTYDHKLSVYEGLNYQIYSFKDSIVLSEGNNDKKDK